MTQRTHLDRLDLDEPCCQERPYVPRDGFPWYDHQVRYPCVLVDAIERPSLAIPGPCGEAYEEDLDEGEGEEEAGEDAGADRERLEKGEERVLWHRRVGGACAFYSGRRIGCYVVPAM